MGKYLHRFKDYDTFDENYNGDGPVTAITVDVASAYTTCGDWQNITVTHDFDGTYIFDREIENFSYTTCDDYSVSFDKARVYKLGNREVYDVYDCPVNECMWSSDPEGMANVLYTQDITNVGAPGDAELHVSSISRGEKPYHEPWVSYTTYDTQVVSGTLCNQGIAIGPCTGEFKGAQQVWVEPTH
jgi:hypothetical protein